MNKISHKLIFEGAELVGKSYIMQQVYDCLEKKYNSNPKILNGCHWFNCDVGIFGSDLSKPVIEKYVDISEILAGSNVFFEKFHVSDMVYHSLYHGTEVSYKDLEKRLMRLGFKVIFCKVSGGAEIFSKRLKDRLALYPHYGRIAGTPDSYVKQQATYEKIIKESSLPSFSVDLTTLPSENAVDEIMGWIGE